ncbi:DUF2397 family protein [Streptomyces bluensis]|uniref:DUF2397 family protein n=1 Tax=Streptomyces bluensis TaxID=33897 RepID=UPI00332E8B24
MLAKLARAGDPGGGGGAGNPGAALDAETLTARLEKLVHWGNLLRSTHTVRATSIAEYQRSRSRYQLSKLGERVQRDADEVPAGADAAREASSERRGPRRARGRQPARSTPR